FLPLAEGTEEGIGARLYRTGDLARYLPDGNIEFLGRADYQVKVRGFRIELEEIEAILSQHPAVEQAVVLAQDAEREPGEKQLVAYVVPEGETAPGIGELQGCLKEKLPAYMVPSTYVVLEALPLLPNGKVDRWALSALEGARLEQEAAYVAPRTPMEEVLATLWARTLSVERVGVHDDFFELGGHSLLATRLISRLRQTFQVEVPLQDLFESPTVAGLAERVEAALRAAEGLETPPIEPVSRDGEPPLSFAQQRLWFLDQLAPGNLFYNIPMAVRLTGELDVEALEQSLNEILRRHEVLRTTFRAKGGKPVQIIAPELPLLLLVEDLSHLPETEREAEAGRLVQKEARRPFDLSQGPLLRARLLKLGAEEHIAVVTMHHIISDGWSMEVFIRELAALYEAFSQGRPSPLPELPVQYADFACWQREWLQGEVLDRQLAYWKEQLGNRPLMLDLPTDRPRPAVQSWRGATERFALPTELSKKLRTLSREEGATLFMTLLAAFQTLLYRYTGQEDVSVGTAIANRNRAEIEGLIGFFVNTLVMRTNLSGEPSFREVLKRVREVALGAYTHQDLPFEMLVEALQPERDLSHAPLFQAAFALQNTPMETLELPGLTLSPLDVDSGTAKFDLTLVMAEGP
ncbi:MAG TPA: non-ribosomal peptide synthetase, partial [Anaerolineae bacterium]|nr:non-ribosomal peptide synthetase [Anaerolineae bacterium]